MSATDASVLVNLIRNGAKSIWFGDEPVPGVYFLLDGAEVVYVGQSRDIEQRVRGHCKRSLGYQLADDAVVGGGCANRRMQFESAYYIEVDVEMLTEIERRCIDLFKPKYNATHKPWAKARLTRKDGTENIAADGEKTLVAGGT